MDYQKTQVNELGLIVLKAVQEAIGKDRLDKQLPATIALRVTEAVSSNFRIYKKDKTRAVNKTQTTKKETRTYYRIYPHE